MDEKLEVSREEVKKAMAACPQAEQVLRILFPDVKKETLDVSSFRLERCFFSVYQQGTGVALIHKNSNGDDCYLLHLGDNGKIQAYSGVPIGFWEAKNGKVVIP